MDSAAPLSPPEPVLIAHLFPALLAELLALLDSLSPADWQRPVHGDWTVKDLVQHLLGDEINILSAKRDGYHEDLGPLDTWEDLLLMINRRNDQWVRATRRMSPRVVRDLLADAAAQANAWFLAADPFATGGPVSWAGPEPAPVWLDIAREFTERWHHQQHIRSAVGQPGAVQPEFLAPVLATFVRALPHTFRHVLSPEGAMLSLRINGDAGSAWTIRREPAGWRLYSGEADHPDALVELPQSAAWQLFTRGITPEEAARQARLSGEMILAKQALQMVSIIA